MSGKVSPVMLLLWKKRTDNGGKLAASASKEKKKTLSLNADKVFNTIKYLGISQHSEQEKNQCIFLLKSVYLQKTHTHTDLFRVIGLHDCAGWQIRLAGWKL